MKNLITQNKFIQILRNIGQKKQQEFHNFLNGLYITKKVQLNLFVYLMTAAPNFENENLLQLDKAYQAVFDKPVSHQKDRKNLLNAFSDLSKWLEDFLLLKKLEEKSFNRTYLLQSIYQELELENHYTNPVQKAYEEMRTKTQGTQNMLALFQLNELAYFKSDKEHSLIPAQHLENGLAALDKYYVLKKLKYTNELISRALVLNEPSKKEFTLPDLLHLSEQLLQASPLHKIYWLHFRLQTEKSTSIQNDIYQTLKSIVFDFPIEDKNLHQQLLIYVASFAAQRFRQGHENFLFDATELYRMGLEKDTLVLNNIFPVAPFSNYCNLLCKQEKFEEARTFLETYRKQLPTAYRQDSYHLGRARIYFGQKKYTKANRFLKRIEFRHSRFKVQAQLLEIICQLETNQKEKFKKNLIALRTLSEDSSINFPIELRKQLSFFITLIRKLVKENISKSDLKKKISENTNLLHKDWFIEKSLS